MLEMPQMIQTWKEVAHQSFSSNLSELTQTLRSVVMDVDGRNGPNELGDVRPS